MRTRAERRMATEKAIQGKRKAFETRWKPREWFDTDQEYRTYLQRVQAPVKEFTWDEGRDERLPLGERQARIEEIREQEQLREIS